MFQFVLHGTNLGVEVHMSVPVLPVPRAFTAQLVDIEGDFAKGSLFDGSPALLPASELPKRSVAGSTVFASLIAPGSPPVVSAGQPGLVAAMFLGVSPELRDTSVRIVAVARRPGIRTKIAVASTRDGVDAVASLLGRDANRVKYVGALLGGERIEVIPFHDDIRVFAANALAPASVSRVEVTDDGLVAYVGLHQRSAAIGGGGLNSSLAGELVGVPITVKVDG
jgi:transcription antitermination factor NusA-like protein